MSVEAAAADGARSHEEVRGKVARLSLGEKTALVKVAKIYARKTRYEYEDLIQECFERVLSGRRQWPQNVPSVVFFTGVMRSIAWEWKSVALPEDAQAIDTGAPERNANSAIDATKLIGIFEDDPIARKLVIAIMDGAKGEELQVLSGLGKTEYESKRTKIRRRSRSSLMPADRESTVKANGLDRLSDVLVEDIATTAGDRLLAEAAQDYGDQGALAAAFDAALAGVPTMHEIVVSSHGADHLADALCNDVLQTSEEHLLREVVQDYGDRRALAAKFDAVVAKIPASAVAAQAPRPRRMLGLTGAGTTRSPAAWLHVFVQERSTVLGRWFSDLSIGRAGVAALATLVLLAVITPGLYRSLDEPASVEPQTGPQISPQSGQQNSPTVPVPQVGVPIIPTAVVEVLSVEKLLHKRFEGLPGADLRRSEPYSREISQFVAEEVVVPGPGLAPNEIIKIRYDIEVLDPPLIGAPRQRQLKSGETTTVRLRNERNVYWLLDSGGEHSKAYLEDLERRYRTVDLR